ncbi:hypothetical protein CPC16_005593 [Podila verticillata]|nr:hypothetical protein CPC16_005593 [Podila verticillata]KAI9240199.1 MAG: hypothetical protein BYD32DRAFT_449668 [Podila humilis]
MHLRYLFTTCVLMSLAAAAPFPNVVEPVVRYVEGAGSCMDDEYAAAEKGFVSCALADKCGPLVVAHQAARAINEDAVADFITAEDDSCLPFVAEKMLDPFFKALDL